MAQHRQPAPIQWIYSDHAQVRAEARGIRHDWIDRAIRHPDLSEPDPNDPDLKRVYKRIHDAAGRVLRVVYNLTDEPWVVVTVLWEDPITTASPIARRKKR